MRATPLARSSLPRKPLVSANVVSASYHVSLSAHAVVCGQLMNPIQTLRDTDVHERCRLEDRQPRPRDGDGRLREEHLLALACCEDRPCRSFISTSSFGSRAG